jgi:signal transduction histidine kinase/DNA-binding response OmpR family regulator
MSSDPFSSGEAPLSPPDLSAPLRAKILIVDDDERNAFAAVQALEALGHELVTARSGGEALKRLLTEEYAVILLDVHMPEMDGYEAATLIRSRRKTRDVPIVFLTAIARDEHHLFQAYSAGAVDVVFKPVDPFILRSKVQVLADLHLKTQAVQRESEYRQWLLDQHARVSREKAEAERQLEHAKARQEAILATLPIVITSRSAEPPYRPVFVSDNVRDLTGFGAEAFLEEPTFAAGRIHPDDVAVAIGAVEGGFETGTYSVEFRWKHADGGWRTFLDQGVIDYDEAGRPREIFGTLLDVTERRMLEEQLTQARKMETVGQLTGGVAHDFNNLLTVVLGNVDLLGRKIADPRQSRQLQAVRHAAERGRSLTRQLLAFSRRQQLQPMTVCANALVRDFTPLMRQAVGEAVTLRTELSEGDALVHVDPAQLESALLNLAVNARDAMPNGGELVVATTWIETDGSLRKRAPDASAGRYLRIEVRDTGSGMAPDVLERVFEPFFTTKEVGKGSGLGLSQVYGFLKQSGGFVTVDSREGEGSVFRLHLPPSSQPAAARGPAAQDDHAPGGCERVLVVEDDASVLTVTVDTLEGLGYRVATAPDARTALEMLDGDTGFDLLFSDVVMPGGLNGLELARAVRERRPELKVLLTSGYVGDQTPIVEAGFPLIDKPFERGELAAKLREVLGAPPPPAKAARRRRVEAAAS